MSNYVLIETRDPFASADNRFIADTAVALTKGGHNVTIFLVQNGVLATRREARVSALRHLAEAGVTLLADDFSLRERGILSNELSSGVQPSGIETLVDLPVAENTKAVWH
jgi:predicted peroxiredoxin